VLCGWWNTSHGILGKETSCISSILLRVRSSSSWISKTSIPTASHDVNSMWSILKESIKEACHLYIPSSIVSNHSYPLWFTSEIRHQFNCIRSLCRKLKCSSSPTLHSQLSMLESSLASLISLARSDYEEDLVISPSDCCLYI